ncbi:hypothetical protein WJX72_010114 [[Myrmecia] bisecta]|uniref:LisH domain-containing protein ARMC9 n=1 Tax=[Myrmecia] bisecta TaxID=41462 RepID=A0AAW1PU66_9CHLO
MASDEADVTKELYTVLVEFLQYNDFPLTLEAFAAERNAKRKAVRSSSLGRPLDTSSRQSVYQNMLRKFSEGSKDEFFALWECYVPASLLSYDEATQKMECYLHIYFATRMAQQPSTAGRGSVVAAQRMAALKSYFETKGAMLARSAEFLPYYALPYVPEPHSHPSFSRLYGSEWAEELHAKLESFLSSLPVQAKRPVLYDLYSVVQNRLREPDLAPPVPAAHSHPVSALLRGQRELSELVPDVLPAASLSESPTRGPVPGRQRSDIVDRWEADSPQDENRNSSNATVLTVHREDSPELLKRACADATSAPSLGEAALSDSPWQGTHQGGGMRHSATHRTPHVRRPMQPGILPPLDYSKIAQDLQASDDNTVACLLQALRWRLTRSAVGPERRRVLLAYAEHDLLGCRSGEAVGSRLHGVASRPSALVQEELARLLNAVASDHAGRTYLLQPKADVVPILCQLLTATPEQSLLSATGESLVQDVTHDTVVQQHALAALQKLSLRKTAQTQMIALDLIRWIVAELGDIDTLSDYMVEYGAALLMNLSLRSAGRLKCEQVDVLGLLEDLVEIENMQVRTYVNGTLYSILQRPAIREAARVKGLDEFLRHVAERSDDVFARQINFILQQLHAEEGAAEDHSHSDDEGDAEDDYFDDEGDDMEEEELESSAFRPGCLQGEELLCQDYLANVANDDPAASNPEVTMMRDSMERVLQENASLLGSLDLHDMSATLTLALGRSLNRSLAGESSHIPLQRPVTPGHQHQHWASLPGDKWAHSLDPKARAAGEAAKVRAKLGDATAAAAHPTADEYIQAFSTYRELPRTPFTGYR